MTAPTTTRLLDNYVTNPATVEVLARGPLHGSYFVES
jgi:hypothetical protein